MSPFQGTHVFFSRKSLPSINFQRSNAPTKRRPVQVRHLPWTRLLGLKKFQGGWVENVKRSMEKSWLNKILVFNVWGCEFGLGKGINEELNKPEKWWYQFILPQPWSRAPRPATIKETPPKEEDGRAGLKIYILGNTVLDWHTWRIIPVGKCKYITPRL